jgi:hypothetical protein
LVSVEYDMVVEGWANSLLLCGGLVGQWELV